jgi:transposase
MVLSELKKYEIISKYNSGLSIMQISNDMHINKNTVSKWIVRYRQSGNIKRKRGSGIHKRNDLKVNN